MNELASSFCSAIIFYTILPLPITWTNSWTRIARWASLVGIIIGTILGLLAILLQFWGFSALTCSAIVTTLWLGLTGGLHLDGAMDTADGLALNEPKKRLEVMKDSHTGAFGVMVAITILLLKTVALNENINHLWLVVILAAGWSRWGQLIAIALYPYLRETGKGAFHKQNLQVFPDILLSSIVILVSSVVLLWLVAVAWWKILLIISLCLVSALIPGYYFYSQLQGHTGDTYGAVVEWSEVLILLCLINFQF